MAEEQEEMLELQDELARQMGEIDIEKGIYDIAQTRSNT